MKIDAEFFSLTLNDRAFAEIESNVIEVLTVWLNDDECITMLFSDNFDNCTPLDDWHPLHDDEIIAFFTKRELTNILRMYFMDTLRKHSKERRPDDDDDAATDAMYARHDAEKMEIASKLADDFGIKMEKSA